MSNINNSAENANNLVVFAFENNEVRVSQQNGEVWFCLKDVCHILDIKDRSFGKFQFDDKGMAKLSTPTSSGDQELIFINEPNLYRVIFRSNKAEAKQFQNWVFNEVLPSIRKTGGYMTTIPNETPEETMARALMIAKDKIEQRDKQIEVLKPKGEVYDRIILADGSLCITDAAKVLQVKPKFLFNWLKSNGWIYRRPGNGHWGGYSEKSNRGYLEHKVTEIYRTDGTEKITEQVRITPKGITKLAQMLSSNAEVLQ